MEGIRKILWRNIKKNKVGVVALCVGCVVCSLLLLCTFVINCSIDQSFNEQYKKMAGPIYVLTVKNDVSEESLIDFVESREYVDVFQASRRCIIKNTKIGDKSYSFAYCETNDKYGKDDFVTCNSACLNAEIGDHVEFPLGDESINLCVENIIDDPVNASPEELNAVVYVSGNMFEEICSYGSNGEYIIRIIDGDAYEVSKLVKDFSLYFEQNFRGTSKMLDDIRHNYTYRYMIVGKYLTPILFFVFVVLIVLSTLLMILVVSDERDTINLYKVIGLPNSKIIIVYLLQYMVLIVSSSILGVAIGAFLLNRWLRTMFIYTRIESFHIVNILGWCLLTWFAITTIELLVLCISLYKNICSKTGVKDNKMSHYYRGKLLSDKNPKHSLYYIGLHMCNYRKSETILISFLAFGVSVLVMFSVFVLAGIWHRDEHLADWGIVDMDVYISRIENSDEEASGLLEYLDEDGDVDYYYAALSDNVEYTVGIKSGMVVADIYNKEICPNLEFEFIEGRNPKTKGEVAVGMNFAKKNELQLGDSMIVTHDGVSKELTVVGVYPSYKQYSYSIRYFVDDIISYFNNSADGYYSVVLNKGTDLNAFVDKVRKKYTEFNFVVMNRSKLSTLYSIMSPVICIVFFCIIIFMLSLAIIFKMMMTDIKEDLYTMKVIGFTDGMLGTIIHVRLMLVITIFVFVSIPVAAYACQYAFSDLINGMGLRKVPMYISAGTISLGVILLMVCSYFVQRRKAILKHL